MNVASQSSAGRSSRSRSRSASTRQVRRRNAIVAFPRSNLKYDGEARICRTAIASLPIGDKIGFNIGASNYAEVVLTYSPTGFTVWGSSVNYITFGLPNAAEISGLWDRVKLDKVELTINGDSMDHMVGGLVQDHTTPELLIGNDVNGPALGSTTAVDMVLQESSCKKYKLNSNLPEIKWTVRPKYQRLIQYTSINSSYEPATGFVQSDTDIPHYGTRIGIANTGYNGRARVSISAKFFFHCKNLK